MNINTAFSLNLHLSDRRAVRMQKSADSFYSSGSIRKTSISSPNKKEPELDEFLSKFKPRFK